MERGVETIGLQLINSILLLTKIYYWKRGNGMEQGLEEII
jgi:hypothetical protein